MYYDVCNVIHPVYSIKLMWSGSKSNSVYSALVIVWAVSGKVKDVFLVFEKKIMRTSSVEQEILALFASFYALNVHFQTVVATSICFWSI